MVQGNQRQLETHLSFFQKNKKLVDEAMEDSLIPKLKPFIEKKLRNKYNENWLQKAKSCLNDYHIENNEPIWNDPEVLLYILNRQWEQAFRICLKFDYFERSLVNELIDVRHKLAHKHTNKFTFSYTWRAFDSMARLLKAIGEAEEAEKIEQQREALTEQNYKLLSESVKKSVEAEINWQQVSRTMLETQKFDRLTSNSLTAIDGVALERDEVYVPLGLVERKQRKKSSQDEGSPEKGSELYREKLIPIENEKFFEQIHHKTKPIAIIGEPGAGKTTLLQKIADWILKEDTESTPIWISLSEIGTKSLTDYLLEDWLRNATQKITISSQEKEAFEKLLESGKVWLLLDGVDEMAVNNPLQNIASQLNQGWINNVRVILTCRLNIWDANKNTLYDVNVYRNLDFNPEQVDGFISNWFQNTNSQKGKNLRSLLLQQERISDLIKNPLRLMLLCYSWQQQNDLQPGKLPSTKAGLYKWFAESFYTWNQGKVDEKFSETELERALGKLAVQAIDSKESRFRLRETFICQYLEESLFEIAKNLGWLNQVGVAAENPNEKVYAFYHPSFEEYFASIAIDDWHFFLNPLPVNPIQGTYRIFEPQWKEVILLWLGRNDISVEQKEGLIKTLVEFADECAELYGDLVDFSVRAYFLAAAATPEFRDNSLKEQIIGKIIELGFGYFDPETKTWQTFPYYVEVSAKKTLKETDNSDVAEVLLDKIAPLVLDNISDFLQPEEFRSIFFNLFWCLNEFAPKHPYVIDRITDFIDNMIVWKETIESEPDIYGETIWITKCLPFSEIKVSNPEIIKAILNFLDTGYQGIIKLREYEKQREAQANSQMPSFDDLPFVIEDELGNRKVNPERIEAALERSIITDETDPLKQQIGLDKKLETAAKAFEAAGDTLVEIAVGNQAAVKLLIELLKKEASNNFESDLSTKIINWLNVISPQNRKAIQSLLGKLKYSQNQIFYYEVAKAILNLDKNNQKALQAFSKIKLNKIQNNTNKLEVALGLLEINSNHNDAINLLFNVIETTDFERKRFEIIGKYNEVLIIIIALTTIAPQNHNIFERLIRLIKNNCHSYISRSIISRLSKINHPSWKLFEVYSDLLEQNFSILIKLEIALDLIKIKPDNNDIYRKLINLFQNRERQTIYYYAALEIVKINPNELDAIKFLIDWVTPEEDIYEEERFQIVTDEEEIIGLFVQHSMTIEPLIEILQTYKRDSSLRTDFDRRYKFSILFSLLRVVADKSNNLEVIAILTDLLQTTEDPKFRCRIARTLGRIAPNNSEAISTLIGYLNEDREDILQSDIVSYLGEISVGNQAIVDALLELMISKDNELEWEITESLQKIIQGNQFFQVVNTLKNCPTSNYSDELLWHCAQNMSYPEFYRAWHHSEK